MKPYCTSLRLILLLLASFSLTGCSSSALSPTLPPTPTPLPTSTSTPLPSPTATPSKAEMSMRMIQGEIAKVCQGGSIPQAAVYSGGLGPHPIVLLSSTGALHKWSDQLPDAWYPSEIGTLDLIVCIGQEQEWRVESCTYIGGPNIDRFQYGLEIQVVTAQTGKIIAAETLQGGSPGECPQRAPVFLLSEEGSHVTFSQVEDWLRPIVEMGKSPLRKLGKGGNSGLLVWSPNGTRLASGSTSGEITVLDVDSGKPMSLKGHTSGVSSLAWSPDSTKLASGSADKTVIIWHVDTGRQLHVLRGHTWWVGGVAWSPDGTKLISGGQNVILWDAGTGEKLAAVKTYPVDTLAWSSDGIKFAGAQGPTVWVWNIETSKLLQTLNGYGGIVGSIVWSPDGKKIASCETDNRVRLWNPDTGEELHTLLHPKSKYAGMGIGCSVAFSPDGRRLASSGWQDNRVIIWDIETGKQLDMLTLEGEGKSVAWSPDGKTLAVATNTSVFLWLVTP
jgi:WD40 repeat protein